MTIRTLNNRIVMQVFHAYTGVYTPTGRVVFKCQPFGGVTHDMLAVHDRWIFTDGNEEPAMYRLHTIDFDYLPASIRWVNLTCSEIVKPGKELFDAIGLGFLEKKQAKKRKAPNLKYLILDDEI